MKVNDTPADLDLTTAEAFANPYPIYDEMRRHPVFYSQSSGGWLVSRYHQVVTCILDDRLSARRLSPWFEALTTAQREAVAPLERSFSVWSLLTDPPEHTRLRRLAGHALTEEFVASCGHRVEEIADELLDAMESASEVDMVATYAYPLPARVMAMMFGIDPVLQKPFTEWSSVIASFFGTGKMTFEIMEKTQNAMNAMCDHMQEVIARSQKRDEDNLLRRLSQVRDGGDYLSEHEVLATAIMMVFAGHETISLLISNAVYQLLSHPLQLAALRDNESLWPGTLAESLRYDTPLARTVRMSTRELEIEGVQIPPRERVILMLGAANRDPKQFPDPHHFDIQRSPNRHLAFAFGAHHCQGSPTTHWVGRIAIRRILERFPELTLARNKPLWAHNLAVRALRSLPVHLS